MSIIPNQNLSYSYEFSGIDPVFDVCPGIRVDGSITSLPQVSLHSSREAILHYFQNSWALTDVLFSGLANEAAFYRQPYHQLRHPLIFYYGHPVALYINKLRVAGLLDKPLNAEFEALFEAGVDEMRWDDLHEGEQHIWPSIEAVRNYRKQAYELITALIKTHPFLEPDHMPITQKSPMWALVMGFEHERIHLETSSVLMRELPIEYVRKPDAWPASIRAEVQSFPQNIMISVLQTAVSLGKPNDFLTFGWDNEYGAETRSVRAFSASKQLISNAEFLEFVKAGGYADEKYWSSNGWGWRRFRNVKWPAFWVQNGPAGSHLFKLRTIFDITDMPMDYPVIVNFHEAKAYCAWKSEQDGGMPYRLLTEAEHHALRDGKEEKANNDLMSGSECSVAMMPANSKGFHDVFGNAWQWCEDHFHPLVGAKPHPYYDDFSSPCYDGQHQMILGGSFISTGDEASSFARFHFRPHFFQHAGFRIARSEDGNPASDAKLLGMNSGALNYETQEMLNKYLLMHWGSEKEIWSEVPASTRPEVVHLPLKCAELTVQYASGFKSVLDIGCAVGRSTFEMARRFENVVGIDYSQEFIESAKTLQSTGERSYWRKDSGAEGISLIATVDKAIDRTRVRFEQGDACALPLHLKDFDAVLMANVLCRLPDPVACLERMQGVNALVKKGGVLVMTTPFSWLEEYTPKTHWVEGIEGARKVLTEFDLIYKEELPFLIREHRRRFEYIITMASVWRRKSD
jgi:5-histidylcysteine sulfoxide synthase/putative 4-mercaptohistidine N1-methyltranferase